MRRAVGTQFLLRQTGQRVAGRYGALGVASAGEAGPHGAAYVVLVVGVEAAPGRPQGWYGELGLAGGVRAVAGWRWGRFPGGWRGGQGGPAGAPREVGVLRGRGWRRRPPGARRRAGRIAPPRPPA